MTNSKVTSNNSATDEGHVDDRHPAHLPRHAKRSSFLARGAPKPVARIETIAPPPLPHPLASLPDRPRRPVRWSASHRRPTSIPKAIAEGWHSPEIVAAADLGQVRQNFKYCNVFNTDAGYSDKIGRAVYCEGLEVEVWRLVEIAPHTLDFQFQPFSIVFQTRCGETRQYTPDLLSLTETGVLLVDELKADPSYFDDPHVIAILAVADEALKKYGLKIGRRSCVETEDLVFAHARLQTASDIFLHRRTSFSALDRQRVEDALARLGGQAPLGLLLEAIGDRPTLAMHKIHAMMAKRIVSFDLTRPPMRDTIYFTPPTPARPDALRAFLRVHAVGR